MLWETFKKFCSDIEKVAAKLARQTTRSSEGPKDYLIITEHDKIEVYNSNFKFWVNPDTVYIHVLIQKLHKHSEQSQGSVILR